MVSHTPLSDKHDVDFSVTNVTQAPFKVYALFVIILAVRVDALMVEPPD